MVFGPPQHGPLGWLTVPPNAHILRRSAARRFRFYVEAYLQRFYVEAYLQQRYMEISDRPFGLVRRTAET
jgi:hypothetical protein